MKKSILASLLPLLLSCTAQKSYPASKPAASGSVEASAYSLSVKVRADQTFKAYWDDAPDKVLNGDGEHIVKLAQSWPLAEREKSFQFTSSAGGVAAASGRIGIHDCDFISDLSYPLESFKSIFLAYNFYPAYADPTAEKPGPILPSLVAATPKLIRYTGFESGDDPLAITCQGNPLSYGIRFLAIEIRGRSTDLPHLIVDGKDSTPRSVSRTTGGLSAEMDVTHYLMLEPKDAVDTFARHVILRDKKGDHGYSVDFKMCLNDSPDHVSLISETLALGVDASGTVEGGLVS